MVKRQQAFDAAPSSSNTRSLRCVIIGDQAVGKTHLVKARARCHPQDVYYPAKEGFKTKHAFMTPEGKVVEYTQQEILPDGLLGEYIPTPECTEHILDGTIDDQAFSLHVWDMPCTKGWTDEEDDAQGLKRSRIYPDTDVFVICSAASDPSSLERVRTKWIQDIRPFAAEVPIILVALKVEFRKDEEIIEALRKIGKIVVSSADGERVAREIGATRYLECAVTDRETVVGLLQAVVGL